MDIPITDNHIHVDPFNGEGPILVAEKFYRAGGRVMIIPNKPTWTVEGECDFKRTMELAVKYVQEINDKTKVLAFALVGPHPAELTRLIKETGNMTRSVEKVKEAMETAQKMVLDGLAVGIGEIGRPHYPVSSTELEAHNKLLCYALELAKDADCPVQLHTESATESQFKEFAKLTKITGLSTYKLVKHFSGPLVLPEENYGLTPSLIATRDVIIRAKKKSNNFLMETDYLDDKKRPGAVLGPKTVPRRTKELLEKEIFSEDDVYLIHKEKIEKIYNITLNL